MSEKPTWLSLFGAAPGIDLTASEAPMPGKGDRLKIRWPNGREEVVTVDEVHDKRDGSYTLDVTADPSPDLPEFYYGP